LSLPDGIETGRIGVYTFDFNRQQISLVREQVAELEELGFRSIWFPEVDDGREAISLAGVLLAETKQMVVVNAVARIDKRSPEAAVAAQLTFADAYPDRHILGLGYGPARQGGPKPLEAMRAYLEGMDATATAIPKPARKPVRLLAAYGPHMVELAVERSAGVHPYKVTTAHTAQTRARIGPEPFLAVEQGVVLESDETRAREIARKHLDVYFRTLYNRAKFKRLGYTEEDLARGGSDRIVDDLIAWGDLERIYERVQEHLAAGADHVTLQVLGDDPSASRMKEWRLLGEVLLDVST
jgi:probable F420-dependent oxidoreductase